MIVREKKKECLKKFWEENRENDTWKVVKCAKVLCSIKEVMKYLQDIGKNSIDMEEEKTESLIRYYFI